MYSLIIYIFSYFSNSPSSDLCISSKYTNTYSLPSLFQLQHLSEIDRGPTHLKNLKLADYLKTIKSQETVLKIIVHFNCLYV